MFGENYPFSRGCLEMRRIYQAGSLGKVVFGEGEYVHPMSPEDNKKYRDPSIQGEYHWRRYLPATYYSSHALAPIMYMTNTLPKSVVAMASPDTRAHVNKFQNVRTDAAGVMLVGMDNGAVFRVNGSSIMAPHGNWYRLSCLKGGVETVRGNEKQVRLTYNDWDIPRKGEKEKIYEAEWESDADKANANGHGGGDYWVVKYFVDAVRDHKPNFLDVYHATAMSAVAILGWRSVLHNSRRYRIPDFSKESERVKWENDHENPFPTEDTPNNIPYNSCKKLPSGKIKKN